jgi:hypothetical protein
VIAPRRERSATRAFVLGLLAMPFVIFAPFAIWASVSSLRGIRKSNGELTGATSAVFGLVAGILALATLVLGIAYWFLA